MKYIVGKHLLLFSHSVVSNSLWSHVLQHIRLSCPSPSLGACWNSCPLSQWCHPTISSSVVPFSSCLQSFPASGSFPVSQLFPSGGQNVGASASASVFPMNIQAWFPLGWAGLISLQSKGSQRVGHNWTTELNWTEFLSYSVNNFRNKTHHWNGSYLVLWYTVWEQETTINIWFLSIWNVTVKTEICCVCKMHPGFQKQYAKENIKYLISIFMWKWKSLSLVRLFVTPWTVA